MVSLKALVLGGRSSVVVGSKVVHMACDKKTKTSLSTVTTTVLVRTASW